MLSFPAPKWNTITLATRSKIHGPSSRTTYGRAASLIIPRIYLSDYFTAHDRKKLIELGVTHVISVIEYDTKIPDCIEEGNKMHVRIADYANADILVHLDKTTDFIHLALTESDTNRVLVHCHQGISRSATVVCAYLVATLGIEATKAIAHAQARRGIICPNPGFRNQLERYSEQFITKRQIREGTVAKFSRIGDDIARRMRQLRGGSDSGAC